MPEHKKRLKSFCFHLDTSSLWILVWYLTKRSNLGTWLAYEMTPGLDRC
jgi:hypothetical protein